MYWNGKQVKILPAREAGRFLKKLEGLDSHRRQLAMAKLTGNFKRGNEKDRKP